MYMHDFYSAENIALDNSHRNRDLLEECMDRIKALEDRVRALEHPTNDKSA